MAVLRRWRVVKSAASGRVVPVVLRSASKPLAVLLLPFMLLASAPEPVAVLALPLVLLWSAREPMAVLLLPRREAEERISTLSGVEVGIASVRWRSDRARRRRKRKAAKREQNRCECNVSIFHELNFLSLFWPFWLSLLRSHICLFTDVLPQFRPKVTRKSGIFESGKPRIRLRQPAFA